MLIFVTSVELRFRVLRAKANMFGFQLRAEIIFEYQTIAELAAQIKLSINDPPGSQHL